MIRALLVDAGGVLFNNVTEASPFFARIGESYGVDAAAVRAAYEDSDAKFENGSSTAVATLRSILSELGCQIGDTAAEELERLYMSCVDPNEEVFGWLRDRARPGIHVFLANNEARDWDEAKQRTFRHFDLFDATFPSWRVGHVKPTAEYFAAVLASSRLEAHEVLLLDDDESCVRAARAQGLQGVLYLGGESLPALW